jgi:hypothetical protein
LRKKKNASEFRGVFFLPDQLNARSNASSSPCSGADCTFVAPRRVDSIRTQLVGKLVAIAARVTTNVATIRSPRRSIAIGPIATDTLAAQHDLPDHVGQCTAASIAINILRVEIMAERHGDVACRKWQACAPAFMWPWKT